MWISGGGLWAKLLKSLYKPPGFADYSFILQVYFLPAMSYSTFHQLLSLQASQANANLSMWEQIEESGQLVDPAPASSKPLSLLLLGDIEVEQIKPGSLPTNVCCRAVGSRYRHLYSALRGLPDLRSDVSQADIVVLAYGREDLCRHVSSRRGTIPIPARKVAEEAIEVIKQLRATKTELRVFCMEALPLKTWDDERRLASSILVDQLAITPGCNGVISAAWCPDVFVLDSGHLIPQGYKAFAQQLQSVMWHARGYPAW